MKQGFRHGSKLGQRLDRYRIRTKVLEAAGSVDARYFPLSSYNGVEKLGVAFEISFSSRLRSLCARGTLIVLNSPQKLLSVFGLPRDVDIRVTSVV